MALALAFSVPLLVCAALWWPVPLRLGELRPLTAFSDSHVWVFEHLWRGLVHGEALEPTCAAGYPTLRAFRPIAGVPAAIWLLLRPLVGAVAAANLVQLLALPLSGLVTCGLLLRLGVTARSAAPLAAVFVLCPNLLGTFATGEISNTQAWILPLALWAFLVADRRWWGVPLVAGAGLCAAVTSPYLALALPLVAGGGVLGVAWARRERGRLLRLGASLLALGLGLLPAWFLYRPDRSGGGASVFRPARTGIYQGLELPHPSPVAAVEQLLWHSAPPPGSPYETLHVATPGLALLLAAAGALVVGWGRPGLRRPLLGAAALAIGGLLLSMGPWVAAFGRIRTLGGLRLGTPVALLEAAGWPTGMGGLYFRYSVIAVLGLVLVVGLVARSRRASWALWALLGAQVAIGVRASGPQWPRPAQTIAGAAWLAERAPAPGAAADGAVLELPLQGPTDAQLGQGALLRAVVHGRPTTGLPRSMTNPADPTRRLWRDATRGSDPARVRAALSAAGVRLVVLPAALAPHADPPRERLTALLGEPDLDGALIAWDLGPTALDCVAVREAPRRPPPKSKGRRPGSGPLGGDAPGGR